MGPSIVCLLFSVVGVVSSFHCPRSHARGLYPNTEDCSKYYQCVDGGRYYEKNCPPGLWFDSRYSICNWPGYVSCYTQKPRIQPLASGEADPVISGKIGRYPQQLGRQIYTTKKRPTYRTNPTTAATSKTTNERKTTTQLEEWTKKPERTQNVPQVEKFSTKLATSTIDPSPGPVVTPQSALDWLYEEEQPEEELFPEENAHPEAPQKDKAEPSPINSVAAFDPDEYEGGFDKDYDAAFDPPPECSTAFSLELDPTRCEGFYQCYLWIPYAKVCPAGLLFDHRSNVCNWPEYVYCLDGERYDPPETTTPEVEETTTAKTPPVPSNNFDPVGNYGPGDNNYDDYWPIEGIEEGNGQQTAFKKKILPVANSQQTDEQMPKTQQIKTTTLKTTRPSTTTTGSTPTKDNEEQKSSVPKVTATESKATKGNGEPTLTTPKAKPTALKTTQQVTETTRCNSKDCKLEKHTVADGDVHAKTTTPKRQESIYKKRKENTEQDNTTTPSADIDNFKASPTHSSSQQSVESGMSILDSKFSEDSSHETSSDFTSSEEEQTGAESHSSEEIKDDNEIVKKDSTTQQLKVKEKAIHVEIVQAESKGEDSMVKNEQPYSSTSNSTSTEHAKSEQDQTAVSSAEESENSDTNAVNDTKIKSSDLNSTTSDELYRNSTDFDEGKVVIIVSKIDTLRNSVETLMSATKQPSRSQEKTKSTSARQPTLDFSLNNATKSKPVVESNTTTALPTEFADNTTSNVSGVFQEFTTNYSTAIPIVNGTMRADNTPTEKVLEVTNTTSLNVTDKVIKNGSKSAADENANSTISPKKRNSVSPKLEKESNKNGTNITSVTRDENYTATNSSADDISSLEFDASTTQTVQNSNVNSTTTSSPRITNGTTNISTANTTGKTTYEASTESTSANTTKSSTEVPQSSERISLASNKADLKVEAQSPGIVILSGKSPIARILEKLLNIRMKQIGSNQFKAIPVTKKSIKTDKTPSENKLVPKPTTSENHKRTDLLAKEKPSTTTLKPIKPKVTAASTFDSKNTSKIVEVPTTNETATPNGNVTGANTTTTPENTTLTSESKTNKVNSTTDQTELASTSMPQNATESNETTSSTVPTSTSVDNKSVSRSTYVTKINDTANVTNDTSTSTASTEVSDNTTQASPKAASEPTDKATENATASRNETWAETNKTKVDLESSTHLAVSSNATRNQTVEMTMSTILNATTEYTSPNSSAVQNTTTDQYFETRVTNVTVGNFSLTAINNSSTFLPNVTSVQSNTRTLNDTDTNKTNITGEKPTTTRVKTTPLRSSRKERETNLPAERSKLFRLRARAPHFEARKVFGAPDERWRFADGTLADPFSRQERDIHAANGTSAASYTLSSALLMTFVLSLHLAA